MPGRSHLALLFTTLILLAGVTTAGAQSLTVMTWNIEHGDYTENAQTDFIVTQNPDVLILQEVNSPSQYQTYQTQLQQKTGVTWYVKYKENCEQFGSPDPYAANPVCNIPDNDGVAILSRLPFQDEPSETLLWGRDDWTDARRALRVKVRVGTQDVQVFGTHLAAGSAYDSLRVSQANQLKTWMAGFNGPRILGGDLNSSPGSSPMQVLTSGYTDAWAALRPTETGSSSYTHNAAGTLTSRIDYWLSQTGSAAQPASVQRPTFPSGTLSDHYPVVAIYSFGSAPGNTPYGGTPAAIPGRIEGEKFDDGGEGVAYHDTTAGNSGGQFRSTDVDIEGTTDTGGGYDVGWLPATEWLKFTVNVASTGSYTLNARVADIGAGGSFHVEVDGNNVTGSLAVPDTGDWQSWTTVSRSGISLTAGQHVITFAADTNGTSGVMGNLNWMEFTAESSSTTLLADAFDSASLDTSKWSIAVLSGTQDTNVPVVQSNGHLNIGPLLNGATQSHYNGILSNLAYDLTGASVRVRAVAVANTATAGTTSFTLPSDSNNHYRMYEEAGQLVFEKKVANVKTGFSIPYDSVQHAWWRIRHDTATDQMVWETAPDAGGAPGSWAEQKRMARELPITALHVELKAGTWKAETNPGTVVFDDLLAARP
jgi:endonuclease/exonuclease/phosphatase family metal-dependent hydrolase